MVRILCLLKWVPQIADENLKIDKSSKCVRRDLPFEINEYDKCALEEALRTRETSGGTITLVTMGPLPSREALYHGIGAGADQAIHIRSPSLEYAPIVTSRALSKAITLGKYDLVLAGIESIDDQAGQIGALVAQELRLPFVSAVREIEIIGETAKVVRELGHGTFQHIETSLPAVFALISSKDPARYVSFSSILAARQQGRIRSLSLEELGLPENELEPGVLIEELSYPKRSREIRIIEGQTSAEIADNLLEILRKEKVIQH